MANLFVSVSDILKTVSYLKNTHLRMREALIAKGMFEGVSWSDTAFAECIGCMKSLCEQAAVEAGLLEKDNVGSN